MSSKSIAWPIVLLASAACGADVGSGRAEPAADDRRLRGTAELPDVLGRDDPDPFARASDHHAVRVEDRQLCRFDSARRKVTQLQVELK